MTYASILFFYYAIAEMEKTASQPGDSSDEDSEDIVEEGKDDPETPSTFPYQTSATSTPDPRPVLPTLSKKSKKSKKFTKPSSTSCSTSNILQRLEERIESSTQLQAKISSMVDSTDGRMSSHNSWCQWMTSIMQEIHDGFVGRIHGKIVPHD